VQPLSHRLWPYFVAAGALAVAAGAAVGVASAPSRAQQAAPVSRVSARAGEMVTLSASHLPANQLGTVRSGAVTLGGFQADRTGNTRVRVRIPEGTGPGDHVVRFCWAGACPAAVRVTVERPAGPKPSPRIPSPLATRGDRAAPRPLAFRQVLASGVVKSLLRVSDAGRRS
jgi:hypothetical protein